MTFGLRPFLPMLRGVSAGAALLFLFGGPLLAQPSPSGAEPVAAQPAPGPAMPGHDHSAHEAAGAAKTDPAKVNPAQTDAAKTVPAKTVPAEADPAKADAVPEATPAPAAGEGPELAAPAPAAVTLPHDLSPWGMFMAADAVVKAVMIGLAFASVVTWTVWLAKSLELAFARASVRRILAALRRAPRLADVDLPENGQGAASAIVRAALGEWQASRGLPAEGIKERVAVALNRIEAAAGRRMGLGMGVLATIGATAPFVGLFGTVWGIMNAFIGISKAHTTNLAVVAPGIAEALLATALGLVAAIPAVVIYNVFARAVASYKAALADTSAEAMRHLSRDLDRSAAGEGAQGRLTAAE